RLGRIDIDFDTCGSDEPAVRQDRGAETLDEDFACRRQVTRGRPEMDRLRLFFVWIARKSRPWERGQCTGDEQGEESSPKSVVQHDAPPFGSDVRNDHRFPSDCQTLRMRADQAATLLG